MTPTMYAHMNKEGKKKKSGHAYSSTHTVACAYTDRVE
jgi:hypothetical protein